MFTAYADRRGVIGFCHEQMVPVGTLVVAECDDLEVLRADVAAKARHARDGNLLLVPGVPEAENDDAARRALRKWVSWAFPTNQFRASQGASSGFNATTHAPNHNGGAA